MCNKPLLQKSEARLFDKKRYIKNLFKVDEKNKSSVLRILQIMPKFRTLGKRQIVKKLAVVCIVTLCFEYAHHFHISHSTYHLRYYIITDHSWKLCNNVLTGYIKLRYVYVKFKRTNQNRSPSKISHSINVE